ncbi:hybrid sensor histidine kinase/response regulator [Leptolyngbya sp. NIES-2104]|uniref:hybrid sensor histidine kinase/response regulator n=1 Tax=Leptolyngbya sp. NIES-2104 TaxID=1552121 RepID=UPI0006EC4472|nr:ATP-binding protein [Leptolyngbya sp. NIES-2104]GAP95423.1 two-component hybrid sensor and regulator [Leptolyngbya sp. NIES-2104]
MVGEKIAIVEDEGVVALSLRSRLEAANYSVTGIADSAHSALSLVANTTPDLVLMDVGLKGEQNGIEVAHTIRDRWKIPVIFLTGYADPEIIYSAQQTDLFGYLIKPINLIELESAIQVALKKHQHQQELEQRLKHQTQELAVIHARLQHEIAARQRTESQITQAIEELHELKSRFITTASHEFRTPLSIILTSTELLERLGTDCPEDRRSRYFQKIRDAVRSMTTILTNALTLRKMGADEIAPKLDSFDLQRFCTSLVSDLQQHDRIQFRFLGNSRRVNLDPELFSLIVNHLVANALKFSKQSIDLEVRTDSQHILITVSDRGLGIPEEDLPMIFEPFHRAKNVDTIPGGGLGLSIVKQCVELQRGSISIQSELGQGTTAQVELPTKS